MLAIRNALEHQDADAARKGLDQRMRSAPGDPELLLLSARAHREEGAPEAAKADLARALDAWREADPEFKLAQEARELEKEL